MRSLLLLALALVALGPIAQADPETCSGCANSLSSNFNGAGVFGVTGPLGSTVQVTVTTNTPGTCLPNCSVTKICKFAYDYKLEFGGHGLAWQRTDGFRSIGSGTSYVNQSLYRLVPGPGWEVEDELDPVDVACGHQLLYFFKIWFDQPVGTGTPSDPNVWEAGPISFTCSKCAAAIAP
jgi:hypothetical protein